MKDAQVKMISKIHPVVGRIQTLYLDDHPFTGGWYMRMYDALPTWMDHPTWRMTYTDVAVSLSDAIGEKSDNFWMKRPGGMRDLGLYGVYLDGCLCGCITSHYVIRLPRADASCGDGWIPRYMLEILKKEKDGIIMGSDRWVAYVDDRDVVWMNWEDAPGWMARISKLASSVIDKCTDARKRASDAARYTACEMRKCTREMKITHAQIVKGDTDKAIRWSPSRGWVTKDDETDALTPHGINGLYAEMVFRMLGDTGEMLYGDDIWTYESDAGLAVIIGMRF